jgi:serine/threonine protein phosphatase 1
MTTHPEPRTIAIGDIHGCALALNAVLEAICPRPTDLVVTLGDYVDRGPDSRGVLDRVIQLGRECTLVPILGNHDEMLLQARRGLHPTTWLGVGGLATLSSYGAGTDLDPAIIPDEHIEFLESCVGFYETETHIFLHASYLPHLPMSEQPSLALYWESLRDAIPDPHNSGKTVIAGHTSQRSGEILDLGHLICIDTCCYGGGWLTALEVRSGQVWQADRHGRMRR